MAASGDPVPVSQQRDVVDNENRDTKIRTILAEGRRLMDDRQFTTALHVIMEAVNACRCNSASDGKARHGKDKSCNISQCVAAVKSDEPDALYRVTQNPCACGYSWPCCDYPPHAVALDTLADCLDRADQHVSAFSTALSIVRLDPGSAVGYCRGAKILHRLLKACSQQQLSSVVARSVAVILGDGVSSSSAAVLIRELLRCFVESALHNTTHYRHSHKDSYDAVLQRIACSLKLGVSRRDPAKALPVEVFRMIFSLLESSDTFRCLRVSKQWNRVVQQDPLLWTDVRLGRPGNPGRFFAAFLQKRQRIKTLVIRDGSRFGVSAAKLQHIVYGLPHLRRLYLDAGVPRLRPDVIDLRRGGVFGGVLPAPARLTQLSLVSFNVEKPVMQLIKLNSGTLEVLDVVNAGPGLSSLFGTVSLPNLKKLRLTEGQSLPSASFRPFSLVMQPLVIATPQLEQLHLDGFLVMWLRERGPTQEESLLWPSLSRLVLGPNVHYSPTAAIPPWAARFLPLLSSEMRFIELLGRNQDIAHNVLYTTVSESPTSVAVNGWGPANPAHPNLHLPNLEVFRCIPPILHAGLLRYILEPAAASGSLKVLELTVTVAPRFPPTISSNTSAHRGFLPAKDLDFALSDNLHTLGLHDFNFHYDPASRFGASGEFDGQPFIDWLECFPKLHTVAVYPGQWEGVASFIMKLIVHPKVKVIHQDYLVGVNRDEALKLAKKHGVELHHTPQHMPVGWPIIED